MVATKAEIKAEYDAQPYAALALGLRVRFRIDDDYGFREVWGYVAQLAPNPSLKDARVLVQSRSGMAYRWIPWPLKVDVLN